MIITCFLNMGLTWIFAFLAILPADDYTRTAFSLIFCILNSFQGFFIFSSYILLSKIKYLKVKVFRCKKSIVKVEIKNEKRISKDNISDTNVDESFDNGLRQRNNDKSSEEVKKEQFSGVIPIGNISKFFYLI